MKYLDKSYEKEVQKLERLFHVRQFPVHSLRCLEVRERAIKHYLNGEPWDTCGIHNHIIKCDGCNSFIIALKNGELLEDSKPDPTEETSLRKEGYSSYDDWKKNMDDFGEAIRGKKDPIEARLDSTRDVDPNLVRSAFRDDKPSEPQEPHDPFLEEIREREKQEGQEETERINRLDRRKLREWLEHPDED